MTSGSGLDFLRPRAGLVADLELVALCEPGGVVLSAGNSAVGEGAGSLDGLNEGTVELAATNGAGESLKDGDGAGGAGWLGSGAGVLETGMATVVVPGFGAGAFVLVAGNVGASVDGVGPTTGETLTVSSPLVSGTSTTAWHLGQRAFLPAYFPSTLNLAEQPVQRQRISIVSPPRAKTARPRSYNFQPRIIRGWKLPRKCCRRLRAQLSTSPNLGEKPRIERIQRISQD
jgi:hypothetical protein